MNAFYGGACWNHYFDHYDLFPWAEWCLYGSFTTRSELVESISAADVVMYHASRNIRRDLICRDGLLRASDYVRNQAEMVVIHGQPETKRIAWTKSVMSRWPNMKFFVSTPDMLPLFQGTTLLPIFGQVDPENALYVPRPEFSQPRESVRVIRRSTWKTEYSLSIAAFEGGVSAHRQRHRSSIRFKNRIRSLLGRRPVYPYIGEGIHVFTDSDQSVVIDNLFGPQSHEQMMDDIRYSDVLLDNDWGDFPGGGTCNLLGLEAMSMGLAVVTGISRRNASILQEWLDATEELPFPLWENKKDFEVRVRTYIHALLHDHSHLTSMKRRSRAFAKKWMRLEHVLPRIENTLNKSI